MMGAWKTAAAALAVLLVSAANGQAQTPDRRFEVRVGVRHALATTIGTLDANETNPFNQEFRLFASRARLEAVTAIEAGLGWRLAPAVRLEAVGSYGASELTVRLTSDVEGLPETTAREAVRQLTLEGVVLLDVTRWRLGARTLPFVSAGGGYLRGLHEDRLLVEGGAVAHLGAGVDVRIASNAGIRLDGRVVFRAGGLNIGDDVRTTPAAGASAFLRF